MKTPKSLLVPVDFSDVTARVLDAAQTLALTFKSRVVLLHVVEPEPDFIGFEAGPVTVRSSVFEGVSRGAQTPRRSEAAVGKSGRGCARFANPGTDCREDSPRGRPARSGHGSIGSHGHGALYHLLAGNVASGVLKSAKCPVLVVPSRKQS